MHACAAGVWRSEGSSQAPVLSLPSGSRLDGRSLTPLSHHACSWLVLLNTLSSVMLGGIARSHTFSLSLSLINPEVHFSSMLKWLSDFYSVNMGHAVRVLAVVAKDTLPFLGRHRLLSSSSRASRLLPPHWPRERPSSSCLCL